jgi:hypothetical protein
MKGKHPFIFDVLGGFGVPRIMWLVHGDSRMSAFECKPAGLPLLLEFAVSNDVSEWFLGLFFVVFPILDLDGKVALHNTLVDQGHG